MLTKGDLQAIRGIVKEEIQRETRGIVREEVENEVQGARDDLRSEMKLSRMRLEDSIDKLADRTKNVEIRVTKMHDELKPMKRDINRLKKDVHYIAGKYDANDVRLSRRVTRIESNLGLSPVQ